MVYFISQLAIFVAVALGIGIVVGYLIWSDPESDEEEAASGSELKELSDLRGRVVALESERSDLAADLEQRMLDLDTRTAEVSHLRAELADVSARHEARGSQLAAMRVSQEELQSLLAPDVAAANWNTVESLPSSLRSPAAGAPGVAEFTVPAPSWTRSATRGVDDLVETAGVELVDTGFAPAAYTAASGGGLSLGYATTLVDDAPAYSVAGNEDDPYADDQYADDQYADDPYTEQALSPEPGYGSPGVTAGHGLTGHSVPDQAFSVGSTPSYADDDIAEYVSPPLPPAQEAAYGYGTPAQPFDEADEYTDDVATYELYDPDQWTRVAGADAYAVTGGAEMQTGGYQLAAAHRVDAFDGAEFGGDDPDDQGEWTAASASSELEALAASVPAEEYEPSWEEEWVDPSTPASSPVAAPVATTEFAPRPGADWGRVEPTFPAADPVATVVDSRTPPPPPPPIGREDVLRPSDWAPWPQAESAEDDAPSSEWFTQPASAVPTTAADPFDASGTLDEPTLDEPTLDELLRSQGEETVVTTEAAAVAAGDETDPWSTGWTDNWADEETESELSAEAPDAAPAAWEWTRSGPIEAPAVGGWPESIDTSHALERIERPGWASSGIAALSPPPPVPQLPPAPIPVAGPDSWQPDDSVTAEPVGFDIAEFDSLPLDSATLDSATLDTATLDTADTAEADTADADTAEFDTAEFDTAEFDTAEFDAAEADTAEPVLVPADRETQPPGLPAGADAAEPLDVTGAPQPQEPLAPTTSGSVASSLSGAPSVDVAMAALQAQLDELRRLVVSSTAPNSVATVLSEPVLSEPVLSEPEAVSSSVESGDMSWDEFSDDLTLLPGSSEEMARHLAELGVSTYQEIGEWGPSDVTQYQAWLTDYPGIIERMAWVSAAQRLWQQTNRKPWAQRTRQDL